MNDRDYEDYNDGSEQFILTMGNDGKPTIKKESDYMEMDKKDFELIQGFIKENGEAFKKYCKNKEGKK